MPAAIYRARINHDVSSESVAAGATGSLKSLHSLMALRAWGVAVRFNADLPSFTPVSVLTSTGERATYTLLSLPLYLVEESHRLLDELGKPSARGTAVEYH